MLCCVTGASGFIGANLVHELRARGHWVRALVRPGSNLRGLAGMDIELIECDLTEPAMVCRALAGCDWCFHAAASYHLWLRDYRPMFVANVAGTRQVLEAAGAAGCSRIVYTSTAGCVGLPMSSNGSLIPSDENAPVSATEMNNPYKISKWQAEKLALELAARGLPIVIVNPTAPLGPRDIKPTPTGRVVLDFLRGAMPAYLDTGLNWVHVRDVAIGHILAAERGRIGERYILGHAEGNWTMKAMLDQLAEVTALPSPRVRIPYAVALLAAHINEVVSRQTGTPPRVPLTGVRMARRKMFYNPAKAIHELGLPQTPPRQALVDAVEWFQKNGYVCAQPFNK